MTKLFLLFSLISVSVVIVNAQATQQTDRERLETERQREAFNQRIDNLRNLDKNVTRQDPNKNFLIFQSKIRPLYRKPSAEEETLLAPEQEDLQSFAGFLHEKGTGLIKLMADNGCNESFNIVASTPHCLKYAMPGAGSSYSFRVESYRVPQLGDLNFNGSNFHSSFGILTHGIMVNIGDIPLPEINLQNKMVEYLSRFQPVSNFEKASAFASALKKGIEGYGFVFGNSLPVKENSTYILRSIAYKGESLRAVDEVVYDELEFDKRKDVIIAFRVVRFKPKESATILWKELSRKDSTKLKM